mmetsp:Transcript_40622/g.118445  ORF Transcript_40622/g.118445 Transcript_40622/m.118445 type:complete len:425 (+) Transcript_40622:2-1276(+)
MVAVEPDLLDADKSIKVTHDTRVSSHSIDQSLGRHVRTVGLGDLDLDLVMAWLDSLLGERGTELYRMKGVLAIGHAEHKYVYHSVHKHFEGGFVEPWAAGEKRLSKMVFIGKNIEPEKLDAAFNRCLLTAEALQTKRDALRFRAGESVQCRVGEPPKHEWVDATVLQQLHHEPAMKPALAAKYQLELRSGDYGHKVVCVFVDSDLYVRRKPTLGQMIDNVFKLWQVNPGRTMEFLRGRLSSKVASYEAAAKAAGAPEGGGGKSEAMAKLLSKLKVQQEEGEKDECVLAEAEMVQVLAASSAAAESEDWLMVVACATKLEGLMAASRDKALKMVRGLMTNLATDQSRSALAIVMTMEWCVPKPPTGDGPKLATPYIAMEEGERERRAPTHEHAHVHFHADGSVCDDPSHNHDDGGSTAQAHEHVH